MPVLGTKVDTRSEAYQITEKIVEQFVKEVHLDRAIPVIIVFPQMEDIRYFRETGKRKYKPLIQYFEDQGYSYIDILYSFNDLPKEMIQKDGHYNQTMYQIVADTLYDYLKPYVGKGDENALERMSESVET